MSKAYIHQRLATNCPYVLATNSLHFCLAMISEEILTGRG